MTLATLLKNAWLKGWVVIVPLALIASLLDAALLGGVRVFLAFLTEKWPAGWPELPVEGELRVAVWLGAMSLVLVLRWLALVVRSRSTERMARSLEATLKVWWLRLVRNLHPEHFHSSDVHGMLRSTSRAASVLPAGSDAMVQALQAFFQLILFLPVLFWISWPLALALLLGLVPWVAWLQRRIQELGPDIDALMARSGDYEADLESWVSLRRSWNNPDEHGRYLRRLLEKVRTLRNLGIQAGTRKVLLSQSMEALSVFATILVLGLCALLIHRGNMSAEDLVLFCSALFICYKPLKECSRLVPQLRDLQSAYQALSDLEQMKRSSSSVSYADAAHLQVGPLSFAYRNSDSPVFSSLERQIGFGRPVLLQGPNGAGKTSLLRLLAGLEQTGQGGIVFPTDAHHGVFFLSQRLNLPPVEWLKHRLDAGQWGTAVADFFHVLDLQRLLAKNGHSGGELQRIGLGWAVASRAPYLFLDEPLAFVAQNLRESIFRAFWNATVETGQWWMMASHEPVPMEYAGKVELWDLGA